MKNKINQTKMLTGILFIIFLYTVCISIVLAQPNTRPGENIYYKIKQVYTPALVRPKVEYSLSQLNFKNVSGELPTYDGEQFQINLREQKIGNAEESRRMVSQFLGSLKSPLTLDRELRLKMNSTTAKTDQDYIERQIKAGVDSTKKRLSGQFNNVSKSSDDMLDEFSNDVRQQAKMTLTIYSYDEYFNDINIDNTAINITSRSETGIVSIHGKFFNSVNLTNKKSLDAAGALSKAIAQIKSENKYDKINGNPGNAALALLPYAEGFKYVWKTEIIADGPYGVWIDAETGKVLQLLPHFMFSDNAKGLAFFPSPAQGTQEMSFEVDAPSGGKYKLKKTGVIVLTNSNGDGVTGIVEVNDDGSGTANFNVAPINGTVVERTNQVNYNGKFQQVNIFAHLFNERKYYLLLGSNAFSELDVTFNIPGDNSYCCPLQYYTGTATTAAAATACTGPCNWDLRCYNAGIDATVIAHEFGHQLNEIQFDGGIGGFTMPSQLHEGMADFWACTNFNTDIFAGWWTHDCATPTQSGMAPRRAEATDIFPDRNSTDPTCASYEGHSAGQIICWANWSARQGMNDAMDFGTLSINLNLIKALFTASYSTYNQTAKSTRDSYLDLLKQVTPLYSTSRLIHKLLAGYARAGIFLSPKDAIIDIDHSYLNRTSATGPVFTIWTGEDYTFSGNNVVTTGTLPFNTQFMVEVANDEAFTVNLKSSGWLGGVISAAGGTVSWTLPPADWTTLKVADNLFYRVTTKDGGGGNIRQSWKPGNNFLGADVPVGKAAINGAGTKDCACSASAGNVYSGFALIPLIPVGFLIVFRRRKPGKRA